MRSMRNSARMQRDRRRLDSFSRTKIAAHVKQYFVGFNVVVHQGNFDRFRMEVEVTRCECTDNVAANLEGLMDRRRLMHRARDRLKILRGKCERINVTLPADDIE